MNRLTARLVVVATMLSLLGGMGADVASAEVAESAALSAGTVNNVRNSDRSVYVSCNRVATPDGWKPTGPYFYVQPGTSSTGDCVSSSGDTDAYFVPSCDFKVYKAIYVAGTWIANGGRLSSGWHKVQNVDSVYLITVESSC
jgi:hypothetical protein